MGPSECDKKGKRITRYPDNLCEGLDCINSHGCSKCVHSKNGCLQCCESKQAYRLEHLAGTADDGDQEQFPAEEECVGMRA